MGPTRPYLKISFKVAVAATVPQAFRATKALPRVFRSLVLLDSMYVLRTFDCSYSFVLIIAFTVAVRIAP